MSQSITQISLIAAFSAGLLSFVSPCVLPLVPSYISYITGLSIEQLTDANARSKFKTAIVVNALLFIAGFSVVFIAFGASASFIGQMLITYQDHIRRIGVPTPGGHHELKYGCEPSVTMIVLKPGLSAGSLRLQ